MLHSEKEGVGGGGGGATFHYITVSRLRELVNAVTMTDDFVWLNRVSEQLRLPGLERWLGLGSG